ncbi:hypothetical protein [Saccharopolyspora sp. CA-218241]|uniref:hypothetical protein n=1 Tax=Saccharopolyspora sp. CA-218241 TaxID=3240027 RepID=UPI003D989E78
MTITTQDGLELAAKLLAIAEGRSRAVQREFVRQASVAEDLAAAAVDPEAHQEYLGRAFRVLSKRPSGAYPISGEECEIAGIYIRMARTSARASRTA